MVRLSPPPTFFLFDLEGITWTGSSVYFPCTYLGDPAKSSEHPLLIALIVPSPAALFACLDAPA